MNSTTNVDAPAPRNPFFCAATGPSVEMNLPGDNRIEIRLERKVTSQEFEQIEKIFELSRLSFVEEQQCISMRSVFG